MSLHPPTSSDRRDAASTSAAPLAGTRGAAASPAPAQLTQYGVIRASGVDAVSFLQAQLSNDLTELHAERVQLACYCTPQGRVLATLLVWRDGADVLMLLSAGLVAPIAQRLSRYVLRAKATIAPASDLMLLGATSGAGLEALLGLPIDAQKAEMSVSRVVGGHCLALRPQLFMLALDANAAAALAGRPGAVAPAEWDLARIRAGIPMVSTATQDEFVPQMLNLERLGGISFTKGCYPGQEIVARAQYRGEVKRRLYRLRLAVGGALPGQEIFAEEAAGTVVDAAPTGDGGSELLAVLRVEAADGRALQLSSAQGPRLTLL